MTKMMILSMAALLPSALLAQKGTGPIPVATPESRTGLLAEHCGHPMDAGTLVDARARNASGEEAFVMRWLDPKGSAVHSALFMGRCVAKDGDTIDGKIIARVLPNFLTVSDRHSLTAWEAEYWEFAGENKGPVHRGVFNDNRFVAELDPSRVTDPDKANGNPDFGWNAEQDAVALKPGIVLVNPPPHHSYQITAPPCVVSPAKQSGVLAKVKKHLESTLEKQAAKADAQVAKETKGSVDSGAQDATTSAINQANQGQPCTPAVKGQGPNK